MSYGNDPAFPSGAIQIESARDVRDGSVAEHNGMTYRQWLLGKALQGLLANPRVVERPLALSGGEIDVRNAVSLAVYAVDMLLEQKS